MKVGDLIRMYHGPSRDDELGLKGQCSRARPATGIIVQPVFPIRPLHPGERREDRREWWWVLRNDTGMLEKFHEIWCEVINENR